MQALEITCFATLAGYAPPEGRLQTTHSVTVADVLNALRIPEGSAAVIFVNGARVEESHMLQDCDHLSLLPLIDGG